MQPTDSLDIDADAPPAQRLGTCHDRNAEPDRMGDRPLCALGPCRSAISADEERLVTEGERAKSGPGAEPPSGELTPATGDACSMMTRSASSRSEGSASPIAS